VAASLLSDVAFVHSVGVALNHKVTLVMIYDTFLLALQPPLGVVFYSPLAGFSLLACEVS